MLRMSGGKIFARYILPCIYQKTARGLVSESDLFELIRQTEIGTRTEVSFISRLVPKPVEALRQYAMTYYGTEGLTFEEFMWSEDIVGLFWRNCHEGDSPVTCDTVTEVLANGAIAIVDGETFINLYKLQITVGAMVSTHMRCVIETLDPD